MLKELKGNMLVNVKLKSSESMSFILHLLNFEFLNNLKRQDVKPVAKHRHQARRILRLPGQGGNPRPGACTIELFTFTIYGYS